MLPSYGLEGTPNRRIRLEAQTKSKNELVQLYLLWRKSGCEELGLCPIHTPLPLREIPSIERLDPAPFGVVTVLLRRAVCPLNGLPFRS